MYILLSQVQWVCDKLFWILGIMKNYLGWNWLPDYKEEMKYELTYCLKNDTSKKIPLAEQHEETSS